MTPMTQLIQERILRLKQEKNACILAHCYQTHDILEVADYVGDSFGLAQNASKTDCSTVIMCGVRFMAEMVKILSPEKQVLLPKAEAGCPMAEQLDPEMLRQLQAAYPDYTTVAYINTTAELNEGASIANQLHELGYAVFVLRYRSFLNASDNAPVYDIGNALKYLY